MLGRLRRTLVSLSNLREIRFLLYAPAWAAPAFASPMIVARQEVRFGIA
jgi:hypothetical protein